MQQVIKNSDEFNETKLRYTCKFDKPEILVSSKKPLKPQHANSIKQTHKL